MPTQPPVVDPFVSPTPLRSDRTTFSARVDLFVTWFIASITQLVALATNVFNNATEAFNNAGASLTSANAAAASAATAAATANASMWVSGTNYAQGVCVISPANFATYRRKVAGAGAVDPSLDAVNWGGVLATAASLGGLSTQLFDAAPGVTANNVVNFSQFSALKSSSGYQVLPSGLIIQWGRLIASGTTQNVTLPISFSSANYSVLAGDSGGTRYVMSAVAIAAAYFGLWNNTSGNAVQWIAIGY